MHSQKDTGLYKALAPIYDFLMADIDYDEWSDFIDELIQTHHPDAVSLLELACGTGNHALSLDELETYDITATDISNEMLEEARTKAQFRESAIIWKQADMLHLDLEQKFDVVISLHDSINYMLTPQDVSRVFENVKRHLNDGGIFIYDFTTSANSVDNAEDMNNEGTSPDGYRFVRKSYYLPIEKLHYNEFEIEKLSPDKKSVVQKLREVHRQRVYSLAEMKSLAQNAGFEWIAAYGSFDLDKATEKSHRITVVLG
jgi:ubiquinone/menaquinone biosynthesis C-methylase UbiE